MSKEILPFYERELCKSLARGCESVVTKYNLDVVAFFQEFLLSDIFNEYEYKFDIQGQGSGAIASHFYDSVNGEYLPKIKEKEYVFIYAENAYWMGYLFLYWKYRENINGKDIQKYSIEDIFYAYEVLHTQDIDYAINFIKEEYLIKNRNV